MQSWPQNLHPEMRLALLKSYPSSAFVCPRKMISVLDRFPISNSQLLRRLECGRLFQRKLSSEHELQNKVEDVRDTLWGMLRGGSVSNTLWSFPEMVGEGKSCVCKELSLEERKAVLQERQGNSYISLPSGCCI
jgi:hypothetical protein